MILIRGIVLLLFLVMATFNIAKGTEVSLLKCWYGTAKESFIFGTGRFFLTLNTIRKINGSTYEFYIKNIRKPSSVEDHITIKQGQYSVTYPLKCKKI